MDQLAYQPLDLAAYRNASATLLTHDENSAAVGNQTFRGLPFTIGEGDAAFIGLGSNLSSSRVTIPVQHQAFCVLFAHRLVGSKLERGEPVGKICA